MDNKRLIDLREEKDLLKKQVAKDIGVAESVYSQWENGKLSISTKRLNELANYFKVNIDYLVGLSDMRQRIKSSDDINIQLVSTKLKEIRKSLKFTMRELANKFNTTSSTISNYENAKFLILSPFLIELSKCSNYSIDWILGRSEHKWISRK